MSVEVTFQLPHIVRKMPKTVLLSQNKPTEHGFHIEFLSLNKYPSCIRGQLWSRDRRGDTTYRKLRPNPVTSVGLDGVSG